MTLTDRFDDRGLLVPGPIRYVVDEKVVREPWPVTLDEFGEVLGSSTAERRGLFVHLRGLAQWFDVELRDDPGRQLWVRGTFAASLDRPVEVLDVVLHYDGTRISAGGRWLMQLLSAAPIDLHPGQFVVTALRHDGGATYEADRDDESIRSGRRVLDWERNQLVTGWVRIVGKEVRDV